MSCEHCEHCDDEAREAEAAERSVWLGVDAIQVHDSWPRELLEEVRRIAELTGRRIDIIDSRGVPLYVWPTKGLQHGTLEDVEAGRMIAANPREARTYDEIEWCKVVSVEPSCHPDHLRVTCEPLLVIVGSPNMSVIMDRKPPSLKAAEKLMGRYYLGASDLNTEPESPFMRALEAEAKSS